VSAARTDRNFEKRTFFSFLHISEGGAEFNRGEAAP